MPIPLIADYDTVRLRVAARASKDANQTWRLLSLAAICDGATRIEAVATSGVAAQIIRDWVMKLNAHGPEDPIHQKGDGTAPILTDERRRALAVRIKGEPIPAVHGVVRRRVLVLCQWLWDGYAVVVFKQTLSRELRRIAQSDGSKPESLAAIVGICISSLGYHSPIAYEADKEATLTET